MTDLPKVSAVIDNYNYGRFLKRCIQSVLDQDYPAEKLEIVVVDDGSTDDSLAVARSLGPRVKILTQSNKGQSEAFNAGVATAAGELVMFLDSDDYWDKDKVRVIAECFAEPSVGIVQHALIDVDVEGRMLETPLPGWPARSALKDFLSGGMALAAASGLAMRKSVLDQVGPIPQDIYFAADAYMIVHGLFFCEALNFPSPKGYHRIHGANNWAEGLSNPKKLRTALEIERRFAKYLAPKLQARGLDYGPRFKQLEDLDVSRREVLLAMHEARRGDAFGLWRGLFTRHGFTRLGLFRCATLALALISPKLYVDFYNRYRTRGWLVGLRTRVLPD